MLRKTKVITSWLAAALLVAAAGCEKETFQEPAKVEATTKTNPNARVAANPIVRGKDYEAQLLRVLLEQECVRKNLLNVEKLVEIETPIKRTLKWTYEKEVITTGEFGLEATGVLPQVIPGLGLMVSGKVVNTVSKKETIEKEDIIDRILKPGTGIRYDQVDKCQCFEINIRRLPLPLLPENEWKTHTVCFPISSELEITELGAPPSRIEAYGYAIWKIWPCHAYLGWSKEDCALNNGVTNPCGKDQKSGMTLHTNGEYEIGCVGPYGSYAGGAFTQEDIVRDPVTKRIRSFTAVLQPGDNSWVQWSGRVKIELDWENPPGGSGWTTKPAKMRSIRGPLIRKEKDHIDGQLIITKQPK